MIVVLTTPEHRYALASLSKGTFGFPAPRVVVRPYERVFRSRRVARATYIFADLERLSQWELRIAGELYHSFRAAGLRCLNDPGRAMARFELLRTLHAAGLNPFGVLRADDRPRPDAFPVFLRAENDHMLPLSGILQDQAQLDQAIGNLRAEGVSPRGLIVVGHCPAPYGEGLFHKWGTFRIGAQLSVDHIAVDGTWIVKFGVWEKLSDAIVAEELDAVRSNRFAGELAPIFDLAGIEFGRADHATVAGRTVIYEINTNPSLGPYVPDPKLPRRETQAIARRRFAAALAAIDTAESGMVAVAATKRLIPYRSWRTGWFGRNRP